MNKIVKLLICYSCLNSSAFSYGMQENIYQDIFSLETLEAWKKYEVQRKHVSTVDESFNIAQALSDMKVCNKDDKIAKYLVENISLLYGSNERKSCWIKCYNTWKMANDLLATLAIGLERIDCDDEMRAYQLAASDLVVNRIKEIHIAQFHTYDRKQGKLEGHSTGHFKENHDADQSATRRLYDAMTPIMDIMRQSDYAFTPVSPDVCFFMMATPDDIKIGEAFYWQRKAELLLFDVQTSLLLEMDTQNVDAIRKALTLRDESLSPPYEFGPQFNKIFDDSTRLYCANATLKKCISDCKPPASKAMAIVNKCKNLARIDCISAGEKGIMMQNSVDMFFDMFADEWLGQFLPAATEPQMFSLMIEKLRKDFAFLREIMFAYVTLYSTSAEGLSEALMSFNETINGARMTEFVTIVKRIPLENVKDPEISQALQEMPAYMRELLMKVPIEFAEMFDREIDCIDYIIRSLIQHAKSISPKDVDIKTYTEGWMQYILEVLKNFKRDEVAYGVQSALGIVRHNRLSGAFNGSYTTENVLDCLFNLINSSIQKTAIVDIMNEMLGASDVKSVISEIVSSYYRIFEEKFGEYEAFELINHRSLNSQNTELYNKYVEELNPKTKSCLLNNTAKLVEISQRLYGDISHAVQLISMISKVDNPYKVYASLDDDIEDLLQESPLKDYIRGIRKIQIIDTVLSL